MPIAVLHEIAGGTQEDYEKVVQELVGRPLKQLSDWPVEGVLCHIAGPTESGWRVVDVWESEEAFKRFGEKLLPAFEAAGVPVTPPEVYPAHNFVTE